MNSRILVIGDLHAPYWHPDTVKFLGALKKHIKPDRVIQLGDEADYHAISFHTHDPNLLSPSEELKAAIEKLKPIYKLFPKVEVIESNHGSLFLRRAAAMGLPRSMVKSYQQVLNAPKGWHWHFDLTLTLPNGSKVYFHHGKSSQPLALSTSIGMHAVQGHYHEKYSINYWANSLGLYWQMAAGCFVDDKSLAMAYNNTNLKRPILGAAAIIDSWPRLFPMVLNKRGKWIGKII